MRVREIGLSFVDARSTNEIAFIRKAFWHHFKSAVILGHMPEVVTAILVDKFFGEENESC